MCFGEEREKDAGGMTAGRVEAKGMRVHRMYPVPQRNVQVMLFKSESLILHIIKSAYQVPSPHMLNDIDGNVYNTDVPHQNICSLAFSACVVSDRERNQTPGSATPSGSKRRSGGRWQKE